jgi:hypothetical protein
MVRLEGLGKLKENIILLIETRYRVLPGHDPLVQKLKQQHDG